ncbi:hypothetical protein SteCoe_26272 [Stentor coeruleus]|uniref:type I protein arginine methyltransferase n=1 Tax=Stentor coeruleus TaxID=5963 RepID=A0A1R2BDA1_9CILI|nr:hypothetical protein SteCoe_26272 [Stentor coeruleus]
MHYSPSNETDFTTDLNWNDTYTKPQSSEVFFESYNNYSIHEEILKDKIRVKSFKNAILRNSYLFQDKIVLNLNCGTGILSFFASKAGAREIYAIDSTDIIDFAEQTAIKNGFKNIKFIKDKIENITLPTYVDIIISDWMGYSLLCENLLESIIYARDKYLIPGGILFPDKAKLFIAGIEDAKYKDERIEFWSDVYGIDMSVFRKICLKDVRVEEISSESIVSTSCPVFEADLYVVTKDHLNFVSQYSIQFTKKDFLHALISWFEVTFSHCHKPIVINTGPKNKTTYWKQSVYYLDHSQPVEIGQILNGSFASRMNMRKNREMVFKISFHLGGKFPLNSMQMFQLAS